MSSVVPNQSPAHDQIVPYKRYSGSPKEARSTGRSHSWGSKQIIVFVKANDNVSLVRKCDVDSRLPKLPFPLLPRYGRATADAAVILAVGRKPREIVGVPRWNNTKDIYVTDREETGEDSRRYVATVKLNRLGRSLKMKRLIGAVKELYVFDSPIPRGSLM